jgi:hypothetical protein
MNLWMNIGNNYVDEYKDFELKYGNATHQPIRTWEFCVCIGCLKCLFVFVLYIMFASSVFTFLILVTQHMK